MAAAALISCDDVNGMSREAFVAAFGDVAEHSPWIAEAAAEGRPFSGLEALIEAFQCAIGEAPRDRRLALIRVHPDLAGKAALAGELADDSRREQSGEAPRDRRLALIRVHPDLAGKAALAGELADDSRREQSGARLDRLTSEEFARFTRLNDAYTARFGFPFIFAVKGATKHQILDAFEVRLENGPDEEFRTALEQVLRIVRFRLEDRVRP
jgi:2-oxo-4-hydroxy-4-carboxy-5-ureidoimidazoline decarboxylase